MSGASRVERPWFIMVTGEPGSGKTTLGTQLAGLLRLPFLSRDQMRGGLLASGGFWTNQQRAPSERGAAVEAFALVAETMAGLGVSAVVELIVFRDRVAALERVKTVADVLVIRTVCHEAEARADRRDLGDRLLNRPEVLDALGYDSVDAYLRATVDQRDIVRGEMRTDLGLPLLSVRTDDGYDPPLEAIADWVIAQTRRPDLG